MRKLALIMVCLSTPGFAQSGTVRLVADTWDNIPEVQIVSGINAPDSGPQENLSNIAKGWSKAYDTRVCYKRSRDPSRSGSGMSASWSCSSKLTSGSEDFSLR